MIMSLFSRSLVFKRGLNCKRFESGRYIRHAEHAVHIAHMHPWRLETSVRQPSRRILLFPSEHATAACARSRIHAWHWEKSREGDVALEVEAILRVEYRRGLPFYEVHWKGYSWETIATETTPEPTENLVGAAQLVREFNAYVKAAP